jgi:hypothetical protein
VIGPCLEVVADGAHEDASVLDLQATAGLTGYVAVALLAADELAVVASVAIEDRH